MTDLPPGDHHTPDSSCRSKSKISHALPLGSPADIPVPVITVDTPESTGVTIARDSEMVQVLQLEGNIPPLQPPISNPTGSRGTDQPSPLVTSALRHDIFHADAPKPTVRSPTPIHIRARMESTLQLMFCAGLLTEDHHLSTSQSRPTGVCVLDDAGRHWLDAIQDDLSAQARIRWLVSKLVAEFLKDPSPKPEAIFEVVILGPVLCEADYRALLSCFIERFDKSALLNDLQGMIQLFQSAPSGFLTDGDLIRIVSSLRTRLESIHPPDRAHIHQLVFAISKVLEMMVRGEVKGLNRQRDHQPLLAALRNLNGVDDDEFLKFQVSYAYQMLLYLSDNETSFQVLLQYAESVAVGVSAVGGVFKLDSMGALAAVDHIQQVASNAIDVVKFSGDGARAFQATKEEVSQAAEMAYWSQKKQPWFLALQAGYLFVQDGRLVDFNTLVCDAACHYDVNFQRGVCQILGEVALNPLWDDGSRRSAIDFLKELCKADADRRKDVEVRKWVASILQQISSSTSPEVSSHARTLLGDLQQEDTFDIKEFRAMHTLLPIPTVFPLLERAQDITDIDHELACIRLQSLEECLHPVPIPLRAKASLLAPEDESFPLLARVQNFLQSENLVFLLLGDSGSGKSIFCRQLERELWNQHQYSDGGRIPLYISLPSIDDPHCDLIEKYLQQRHDILEPVIREIKHGRQLVLICDGYDEPRLIHNLHTSNRLNRPGQWKVKMIITCRSTFLGPKYQGRFYPLGDDKYHDKTSGLFEEATIVPFQESDIQEFVKQYVLDFAAQVPSDSPPAPSFNDYWKKLTVIPNLMNLVSNPFLLTLALKALPSRSIEALDSEGLEAMQQDLYDGFIQEWASLHEKRLHGAILKQDIRAAFISLLDAGFDWCLTDYIKRLADAIYEYQDGNPVVKFSLRYKEKWKVEFFGPEIETTLLREASPLTRAGIEYQFIHKSMLDYIYSRTFFDPDDSDNDNSNDGEDDDDDSQDGGDDFHGGGGNSLGDGGDGVADDNGDLAGGNGESTGGDAESTGNNGGSSGGNGGSSASENQNSSGGGGNTSGGNNDGSRGNNNGSNDDEDGSRRRKDARSKRKGNATKSRLSTSSDPFSKRNLFKEPPVLQFLVERAKSDSRLKKRLFSAIEKSKASSAPSMAAANAITILFKSGNLFQDTILDGVSIPSDYMSTATGSMEPVQLPEINLTGGDLLKVLMTPNFPVSAPTFPATTLAVPVSAPSVPAPMTFSTTTAQTIRTASLRPPRYDDKNRPPSVVSQASNVPSRDNQSNLAVSCTRHSTTSRTLVSSHSRGQSDKVEIETDEGSISIDNTSDAEDSNVYRPQDPLPTIVESQVTDDQDDPSLARLAERIRDVHINHDMPPLDQQDLPPMQVVGLDGPITINNNILKGGEIPRGVVPSGTTMTDDEESGYHSGIYSEVQDRFRLLHESTLPLEGVEMSVAFSKLVHSSSSFAVLPSDPDNLFRTGDSFGIEIQLATVPIPDSIQPQPSLPKEFLGIRFPHEMVKRVSGRSASILNEMTYILGTSIELGQPSISTSSSLPDHPHHDHAGDGIELKGSCNSCSKFLHEDRRHPPSRVSKENSSGYPILQFSIPAPPTEMVQTAKGEVAQEASTYSTGVMELRQGQVVVRARVNCSSLHHLIQRKKARGSAEVSSSSAPAVNLEDLEDPGYVFHFRLIHPTLHTVVARFSTGPILFQSYSRGRS
ncbi:WD_REPEATS_REGION domain-containing protein [Mortierella hygrophila]|uniref:WD_REPEATS_REGION domain-containing protein n=1 Tax=Mortierella hygrophila TaxID=979708 RepID=A0A9P6FFK3_9FUNG|nr:WD_REPEATS_REGION domain-containing protein [Mortierella hygrophila]